MSAETGHLTLLHLSDVHATDGELLYGAVDGLERLERVGAYVVDAGITPEAIVITGDLIQRGHSSAYPALGRALDRLQERVGAPVLTALGNHDDQEAARLLPGHADGHDRVVEIGGLGIVLLDSHDGALGSERLAWLAEQLAAPRPLGTVVALHHPPLASPLPTLARQGLRDAEALLDTLAGTDVRVLLAGHFHHPLAAVVRSIPVSVGPSLAYHQVMNAGPDRVSGHDSAMFSLLQLGADSVTGSTVSLRTPEPLFTSLAHRDAVSA
ncbi:3',5'-cyclic AMP phosphodiesterase CpdA [Rathayibacter oskolensis]|uniref:3',5'-cyclic AMP phosphodiesterase CpdA n=1 Tax=Rathayibacter oskolensis TaxID=1891671 RepID=A0A1X7PD27_9MICO|nr:metallophosphoesterase [Rathayibacter oskolensis]SMH48643.1 3',5'-cyclic AMP phosphodiesterase CpdA [Rathayibacter oskolensis]